MSKNYNIDIMQPDELNALKTLVKEFIERLSNVDNELELLKEDRKELIEEYKEKLDTKTLNIAMRVMKMQRAVQHKDTFDMFMEILGQRDNGL
jgi:uncharacterized protein (UPF0335 family)